MAESPITIVRKGHVSVPTSITKYNIVFSRYGNIVTVSLSSDSKSAVQNGDIGNIGTIPEGFRPRIDVGVTTSKECTHAVRFTFDSSGPISAYNYSGASSGIVYLRLNPFSYYTEDD